MDLKKITKSKIKYIDGIYYSEKNSTISYPKDGNDKYLEIEEDSFWFNHRNNIIINLVNKFSSNKIFFDIGGGNGFVSKGLQDSGINVVLIEPGISGALNAKNRKIKNIICSTLEDAEFEKSSLESIGLFDVIEHIPNEHAFLKNIYSYLKEDGYLFITVPAYNLLWSSEDDDAGHYKRYTLNQLSQLLVKSGFNIVYSTYFFSILLLPIFFFRSLPSKIGIKKTKNDLSKNKKEHTNSKGIFGYLISKIWNWELKKIKELKKIAFGGSCFIIVKK